MPVPLVLPCLVGRLLAGLWLVLVAGAAQLPASWLIWPGNQNHHRQDGTWLAGDHGGVIALVAVVQFIENTTTHGFSFFDLLITIGWVAAAGWLLTYSLGV